MSAAAAAALAAGAAAYWGVRAAVGAFHPRSEWFGPVLSRGVLSGPEEDRVALTFDDGPHAEATGQVLDVLGARRVRAAFFVIGRHVDEHPHLVRRMVMEGHLVGNHTYDHDRTGLFWWGGYWREQIERCSEAIERAAGEVAGGQPRLFRPPMGFKSRFNMRAAAALGQTTVTWSLRGRDGVATTAKQIVRRLEAVRPGEVVLLHDGVEPSRGGRRSPEALVEALPDVLALLEKRRLRPVRLDELLGLTGRESGGDGLGGA